MKEFLHSKWQVNIKVIMSLNVSLSPNQKRSYTISSNNNYKIDIVSSIRTPRNMSKCRHITHELKEKYFHTPENRIFSHNLLFAHQRLHLLQKLQRQVASIYPQKIFSGFLFYWLFVVLMYPFASQNSLTTLPA